MSWFWKWYCENIGKLWWIYYECISVWISNIIIYWDIFGLKVIFFLIFGLWSMWNNLIEWWGFWEFLGDVVNGLFVEK